MLISLDVSTCSKRRFDVGLGHDSFRWDHRISLHSEYPEFQLVSRDLRKVYYGIRNHMNFILEAAGLEGSLVLVAYFHLQDAPSALTA